MKRFVISSLLVVFCNYFATAQTIKADEAAQHIGDSTKVCGKIFGGRFFETSNSSPTLLNMGAAFPNHPLTIMIPLSVRKEMGYAPELQLKDKNVCVTGKIVLFKEKPEIVLYNTKQLKVE
ncbi:hypothetical protein ACFOWM_08765 [Ferruginibacter yonginensis]|uniref:Uncharacterized protein n=1 Tax=Ferruginibacter yonginensis TaxID=1310416 RepID=A0ABV8QRZ6_9BACT